MLQGVLAPVQFLVFLVSLVLVWRYLEVERAIETLQHELILDTQMERHIGDRVWGLCPHPTGSPGVYLAR